MSCDYICYCCKKSDCNKEDISYTKCEDCGLNCYNNKCLAIHKKEICIPKKKCLFCNQTYIYKHICDEEKKFCSNCKSNVDYDHRCFIKKEDLEKKDNQNFAGYIFFDYEASQDEKFHLPNLAIAHKYDSSFNLIEKKYFYENGANINNNFCKWLFNQKNFIAIAHNLKGYDGVFIMNYLLNNLRSDITPPKILNQGNKILSLSYKKVKLLDSLMFLPMPLSEFSKTFKLHETKGYFPHLFNTIKNQNY